MIGFMVWNTGSESHPFAFVYAADREQCKRRLAAYLRQSGVRKFNDPDNWIVEPVTRKQDYVIGSHVVCPNIDLL